MKFNVSTQKMYQAASTSSKIIASKNSIQILDYMHFSLVGDKLTISAGDPENDVSATVTVSSSDGEGQFCLPADKIVDFLKDLPDMGIEVTVDDNTLQVDMKYETGEYHTVALKGDEYPRRETELDPEKALGFSMTGKDLVKAIALTSFAVSDDDYRVAMTGILLDVMPENINFVATDTRKLVKYTDARVKSGATGRCILPIKPATIIKSMFDNEEPVNILISEKTARFANDTFVLNCSLINNRYPDYNRVIPKDNPNHLIVDRSAILPVVKRIAGFTGEDMVKIKITPSRLFLKSKDDASFGSAREEVPCSYEGKDMSIGFGSGYLIAILSALPSGEISIDLGDPSRPGIFHPAENTEGTDTLMLLMPMSINEF